MAMSQASSQVVPTGNLFDDERTRAFQNVFASELASAVKTNNTLLTITLDGGKLPVDQLKGEQIVEDKVVEFVEKLCSDPISQPVVQKLLRTDAFQQTLASSNALIDVLLDEPEFTSNSY